MLATTTSAFSKDPPRPFKRPTLPLRGRVISLGSAAFTAVCSALGSCSLLAMASCCCQGLMLCQSARASAGTESRQSAITSLTSK